MRVSTGKLKIDGIFLGEIQLDLFDQENINMRVTAGYIDSKTRRKYGSTSKMGGWSPETLRCLNAFIEAVEKDIAADVFEGESTGSGIEDIATTIDGVPGL